MNTAIRVSLIYKNGAKHVQEGGAAIPVATRQIRGMSRYSWGRPRVTRGVSHDGARSTPCAVVLENGRAVANRTITDTDTPHMVVTQIGFRAKPHKRPEILSAIDEMIDRMRTSSGCGRSRLVVDCEDPNAFTVLSEWQSTDAANAFLESRGFQLLRGIRMLLRGEPLVVVDEVQQRVTRLLH